MLECYITSTGSFLPGDPVDNESIANYLGEVAGELRIKEKVLKANGIKTRHYALDLAQNITYSPYELATQAVQDCLKGQAEVDYLSAGSTHTSLLAPGLASLLHDELSKHGLVTQPLEINSNSGICSSGAQALVNASRAVKAGDAATALCVGVEQPSANFRSAVFHPPGDPPETPNDLKNSVWFMSTFLRFMLSDGAGAFLLEAQPKPQGLSLKVDWTYSRSFANEAPLCMHLPSQSPLVLSQDVKILSKYMAPLSDRVVGEALSKYTETLDNYTVVLPHMSS